MQHPAKPSDDAWMGNMLVDPARGKAHAAGPEERMGRKDLFDLMQQKILGQAQQGSQSSRVRNSLTMLALRGGAVALSRVLQPLGWLLMAVAQPGLPLFICRGSHYDQPPALPFLDHVTACYQTCVLPFFAISKHQGAEQHCLHSASVVFWFRCYLSYA